MGVLIDSLTGLAAVGFAAVLAVHLAALFGATSPFDHWIRPLVYGLFIVWFATVLVANRLTREFKQKDLWRAALRGCPRWLQRSLWVLCGYSWAGFFVLPLIYGGGMNLDSNRARIMSGGLLAFYAIAACIFYSATQVARFDEARRCRNGHRVSALAKYCDECGAPVQPVSTVNSEH